MSSEVKRYDPINSDGTCGMCVEDADYGAYVDYADYAALEAELARLRAGQEPVAAQVRFRRPEKGLADWSVWQQTTIKPNMPAWSIDSAGYEVEYRLLYTAPQPSAGVVVPDAITVSPDWLKQIHRDLDACQKLIWANLRGCDPAYCADAQARLAEIEEMLARLNGKEVGRG